MSYDLISRSALMQSLRNNLLVDVTPNLEQAIEEQPIAYDVDKVVEQLEDKALEHAINGQQFGGDGYDFHEREEQCIKNGIEESIKIVKAGTGTGIEEKEECSSAKEET